MWTGKLKTRFLILTNELPRLTDASGALAGRFIILVLDQSFYGREDHGLSERLITELPGIMNWAIDGLDLLQKRGYFVPPASSRGSQAELEDLSSQTGAFVRDKCLLDPLRQIDSKTLYDEWCKWCTENGHEHVGTTQLFGRNLSSAASGVKLSNPLREAGGRIRYYKGITLRV